MVFFEDLSPYLRPRVAEIADVPPAGHIARFDNGVHYQAIRIGTYGLWTNVIEADFTLFLGADRSSVLPPMEIVSRILVKRQGYRFKPLGDVLGGRALRAHLRRGQKSLGAQMAAMGRWRLKPRGVLEAGTPPFWVMARFTFLPISGRDGYGGYDWETLGSRILRYLDDLRALLAEGSTR